MVDIASRRLVLASLQDTMLRPLGILRDRVVTTHSLAGRLLRSSLRTHQGTAHLHMDSLSHMGMVGPRRTLPPAVQEAIRPMDSRRHRRATKADTDVMGY